MQGRGLEHYRRKQVGVGSEQLLKTNRSNDKAEVPPAGSGEPGSGSCPRSEPDLLFDLVVAPSSAPTLSTRPPPPPGLCLFTR